MPIFADSRQKSVVLNDGLFRARDTIELMQRETPDFISTELWLHNSPDLNPCWLQYLGSHAAVNQSINQSLFKIRQPEPIVTRPKQLEKNTHTTQCRIYNTDRREKRETMLLSEPAICCRRSHQYFSAISSNRGKANSFSIKVTLYKNSSGDEIANVLVNDDIAHT